MQAIAEQEGISVVALRWFDLQTHRGYQKRPGEYELDELAIGPTANLQQTQGGITEFEFAGEQAVLSTQDEEDFRVTGWRRTLCPPEVLELFREYIGEPRTLVLGLSPRIVHALGYVPLDSDDRLELLVCIAKSEMAMCPDVSVAVVDNAGSPEDLRRSGGVRYTMWEKDETPP